MELVKKQICRNQMGRSIVSQFIIDNDYNVPDVKKDISQIVTGEGRILVDEIRPMEQYVRVKGKLEFQMLYMAENGETTLDSLNGKIPFEEMVYVEEKEVPYILRDAKVEMSTMLIHSRKISIKAMCELEISSEEEVSDMLTVGVDAQNHVYKRTQEISLLKLCYSKKDHYRIKEELQLPGTKETIGKLLWSDVSARKTDTKLESGNLVIVGELLVFCFYESPDGKLDWTEQVIPYEGRLECPKADATNYHYVNYRLGDVVTEVRCDEDGEKRLIGVEGTMEARFAIYEEEKVELLEDLYSLSAEYETMTDVVTYEEPFLQNHSKCKLTEQLTLPELKDNILQICHSNGMIQIESTSVNREGILVEGVLHVSFLYVRTDDSMPFGVWQGMVPFSHVVAAPENGGDIKYDITNALEQLTISLLGGDSIEVKAVLAFHSFLRQKKEASHIVEITEVPCSEEAKKKGPGIVGYIVKEGDNLWNLAKRYRTTEEGLRSMNQFEGETLKTGQRILILKENTGIL